MKRFYYEWTDFGEAGGEYAILDRRQSSNSPMAYCSDRADAERIVNALNGQAA